MHNRTSLVVQWSEDSALPMQGHGFYPWLGEVPHATWSKKGTTREWKEMLVTVVVFLHVIFLHAEAL